MRTWLCNPWSKNCDRLEPAGRHAASYLRQIVSGALTGVGAATLNAAMSTVFSVGGWCPKGSRADDAPPPASIHCQRPCWQILRCEANLNEDESDARHLAHILRLGLLPEGHIMPKAQRAARDLARKRMQLVQQRTVQILSIETLFDQQRGAHLSSNNIKKLTSDDIDGMGFGSMEAFAIKANLSVIQALQTQIAIEKELAKHCRSNPAFTLLKSVSGIGEVLATVILLETGNIERFADVGSNFASHCRVALSLCRQHPQIERQQERRRQQ